MGGQDKSSLSLSTHSPWLFVSPQPLVIYPKFILTAYFVLKWYANEKIYPNEAQKTSAFSDRNRKILGEVVLL